MNELFKPSNIAVIKSIIINVLFNYYVTLYLFMNYKNESWLSQEKKLNHLICIEMNLSVMYTIFTY